MTCTPESATVWPAKDPDDTLDYAVDFEPFLVNYWERGMQYTVASRVRPNRANGFEYECTVAGQSAHKEPIWPTTIGQTRIDGSITWTCRAVSSASLRTTIVGVPVWESDDLTISGESASDQLALANISGGEDGESYSVLITATFADGTVKANVCILPVKRAELVCDD